MMKKLFTIILVSSFSCISYAQRLKVNSGSFKTESITNSTVTITTGYDTEFDAAVKFAFDKYWKVCAIKYIVPEKKNQTGDVYLTGYKGRNYGKYTWSCAKFFMPNITYDVNFDNFKKGKKDNGLDKNYHMMAIKIIPYIMCLSAEVQRVIDLGETKWGGMKYKNRESLEGKIKNYTVLIQKENLDNGRLTELPFKTYLNKYEFVSSEELYEKMKTQTFKGNTALLVFGRDEYCLYLSIIDMKTGDLLYQTSDGLGSFTQGRQFSDKVMTKFLRKIEK